MQSDAKIRDGHLPAYREVNVEGYSTLKSCSNVKCEKVLGLERHLVEKTSLHREG